MRYKFLTIGIVWLLATSGTCSKKSTPDPVPPPPSQANEVDFWLTTGSQTNLLSKQTNILTFGTSGTAPITLTVDSTQRYQSIDGFGYTLTSGSATLINGLDPTVKASLLQELFGSGTSSIGISYLRISIGASDLSASVYSYDDMPAGQTDPNLTQFTLDPDRASGSGLIPLLKEILLINPAIKILGSPWSPPLWMKTNELAKGGSLRTDFYGTYANYFVKYIQQMKAEGINIDAITPQNEPLNPDNTPSLLMTAEQQRDFIKNNLGPAFQAANISTKIIVWDHNCDVPTYPTTILSDDVARGFVDGSAFHLYAGEITALSAVRNQFPDKNIYFTEQYTPSNGSFEGDLKWHIRNVIIGSMRNWSRNALEWNLANDPNFGPHTVGGCTVCKGALTINGTSGISRNVSYYIIAHASKFVPAGSVRIQSDNSGSLYSVAFETPVKKKVLIVLNEGNQPASFLVKFREKWFNTMLPASAVGTYTW